MEAVAPAEDRRKSRRVMAISVIGTPRTLSARLPCDCSESTFVRARRSDYSVLSDLLMSRNSAELVGQVVNLRPWACGTPKCDENQSTDGPDNPQASARGRGAGETVPSLTLGVIWQPK